AVDACQRCGAGHPAAAVHHGNVESPASCAAATPAARTAGGASTDPAAGARLRPAGCADATACAGTVAAISAIRNSGLPPVYGWRHRIMQDSMQQYSLLR